jgi:hypothetical protein
MSIAVDMEGGMASYVGAAGAGAEAGAGSDAARAAAIDGAAIRLVLVSSVCREQGKEE